MLIDGIFAVMKVISRSYI